MSKIEFVLSVLVAIYAALMLVNVFITPSVIRVFSIIVFSIMFLMSIILVRLTFKEMREDKNIGKI